MLGSLVGYTHYAVTDPIQYQNEQVFVVEAETCLNLELGGAPCIMEYKAMEYYAQNLEPRYYKASITVAGEQSEIECSFEEEKIIEKIQSPDGTEEKEISVAEGTYLLERRKPMKGRKPSTWSFL